MHHLHGPLRHHRPPHERDRQMNASEEAAGKEALDEAVKNSQATGAVSNSVLRRGEPGREIVDVARELDVSLIVLRARKHPDHHPKDGPGSIGHTARFVLDHAYCNVLLLKAAK